eukprot:TRINITY_DN24953_c0_g1_i1.p1 TRINITY_DN24953_c0_g1~~TRINITY_DN24953_c0_g1_i1.p1  ORF type:complete len:248 (-),score=55.97 TRINITY_DN24953_c0_g1_i1:214-957(-)
MALQRVRAALSRRKAQGGVRKHGNSTERKIVHVIRHAEAQHNVSKRYLGRRDTLLTPRGRRQAQLLSRVVRVLRPDVVVTSPILRALQTTRALGLRKCPTLVQPHARERVACPTHLCDLPVAPSRAVAGDLRGMYGKYDWSLAKESASAAGGARKYCNAISRFDLEAEENIHQRARQLTKFLEERPEPSMALVSHGGFLMYLTGDSYMQNCEVRSYEVIDGEWRKLRRGRRVIKGGRKAFLRALTEA